MVAPAVYEIVPPPNGELTADGGFIDISSWSEEAFQVSLQTVRALSEHRLKRDPSVRRATRPRPPATAPLDSGRSTQPRLRTRWQVEMQKRAHLQGKTVEELREEERQRGIRRRAQKVS